MAATEDRVAKPERQCSCRHGTPKSMKRKGIYCACGHWGGDLDVLANPPPTTHTP